MNYRHACLRDDRNCGHLMSMEFPEEVANVLINTVGWDMCPLQSGKWDAAFEQMPEDTYAFDLKESPFGKDRFDHCFFDSPLTKLRYEDMFTGVIFYKPLYLHYTGFGFPYMLQLENVKMLRERSLKLGQEFNESLYYRDKYLRCLKLPCFVANLLDNILFVWNLIWGVGMLIYLSVVCARTKES